jgi:hypothetical protein
VFENVGPQNPMVYEIITSDNWRAICVLIVDKSSFATAGN